MYDIIGNVGTLQMWRSGDHLRVWSLLAILFEQGVFLLAAAHTRLACWWTPGASPVSAPSFCRNTWVTNVCYHAQLSVGFGDLNSVLTLVWLVLFLLTQRFCVALLYVCCSLLSLLTLLTKPYVYMDYFEALFSYKYIWTILKLCSVTRYQTIF